MDITFANATSGVLIKGSIHDLEYQYRHAELKRFISLKACHTLSELTESFSCERVIPARCLALPREVESESSKWKVA